MRVLDDLKVINKLFFSIREFLMIPSSTKAFYTKYSKKFFIILHKTKIINSLDYQ